MTLARDAAMEAREDVFSRISELRKAGRIEDALRALRLELKLGRLDGEGLDRAGRLLRKLRPTDSAAVRVKLLGQYTTHWLATALIAVAYGQGVDLVVDEGGYDSIIQDLAALGSCPSESKPSIVALLPWSSRLTREGVKVEDRIAELSAFWKQAWDFTSRSGAKLLQVGLDWAVHDELGHSLGARSGNASLVRRANVALLDALPPGAYFVDLEQISGEMGRSSFYDMRRYYWTKQPFSEAGVKALAEALFAGIRALTVGPKKVLVLDLDNTLWGGVVGELGPHGIGLGESPDGEAFRAFQLYCKELSRRGVLLTLASKNNPADAYEPFQANPGMILSLDDFAAIEIGWEPKGTTIARLAQTLNLGIDSFVFFDDNPAEREQVRQALPDVAIVDVPEEPAEYVRALQKGLWFEAVGLTNEDRVRAEQYAVERQRRDLAQSSTTMEDYLRSLEMVADVREFDEADLPRVVQLLGKTNQFNVTTRRHSREDVLDLIGRPGAFGITLRVRDRFGDHGLVGLVIATPDDQRPKTLRIDTWLMSCRVIARTVEEFQFQEILRRASDLGYEAVLGEYVPTKKNILVADLFDRMGFAALGAEGDSKTSRYLLDLAAATAPATFVQRV
jgi:FkbH-like protein